MVWHPTFYRGNPAATRLQFNPRTMGADEIKLLRSSIRRSGLNEPGRLLSRVTMVTHEPLHAVGGISNVVGTFTSARGPERHLEIPNVIRLDLNKLKSEKELESTFWHEYGHGLVENVRQQQGKALPESVHLPLIVRLRQGRPSPVSESTYGVREFVPLRYSKLYDEGLADAQQSIFGPTFDEEGWVVPTSGYAQKIMGKKTRQLTMEDQNYMEGLLTGLWKNAPEMAKWIHPKLVPDLAVVSRH